MEIQYGTGCGNRKHILRTKDNLQSSLCGAYCIGQTVLLAHAGLTDRQSKLPVCKKCLKKQEAAK